MLLSVESRKPPSPVALQALAWLPQLSSSESPAPKAASIGLTAAPGFFTPGLAKERDMPAATCVHSSVVDHVLGVRATLQLRMYWICQITAR